MQTTRRWLLASALLGVFAGAIAALPSQGASHYAQRSIKVTIKGLPHGDYSLDLFKTGDAKPTQSTDHFSSAGAKVWTTKLVATNNRYFVRLHVYQDESENKQPPDFNLEDSTNKDYDASYEFSKM